MGERGLMVFGFEGRDVRVTLVEGEPWWVVRDVCEVLDLGNPSETVKRLEPDEVSSTEVIDSLGRRQTANIVSEGGLYSLILGSRKPEAKAFKRWVTHEVLPTIRKNGMYVTEALLDDPEHLLQVTERLVQERRKRLEEQRARLAAETKVKELTPKAEFHDQVAASVNCVEIGEFAKAIGTGQNRLFKWLRQQRILMPNNHPYQDHLDADHFQLEERRRTDHQGQERTYFVTVVTGKGQTYLHKRWSKAGNSIQAHLEASSSDGRLLQ